ncbi:GreA/GreB family elongation factor [Sphingomonas sp. NSE70-1]|uniref:GreA/GreB family elongation factor n=1 Tax=Sphingomonas caseinilyticus TaxID=2908205 RepID=A0ABT0RUR7_9SPHN|nr:GreA/GreB family elongation factor [Sphingomonas caseinilyticus]MCL6698740.1 GreA/GreB family elongation factor [Sphingomonas caseinilyticus]
MSVAFRRESDEEHLEPKFELPIPPGPNLVTPRGFELIRARNEELEAKLESQMSEEERKSVLRDAKYWRQRLASAELAPPADGSEVALGTRVTFVRNGQTQTLDVVGHDESEPSANRVAFTAPLVRALMGAEIGDEVEFASDDEPILILAVTASSV